MNNNRGVSLVELMVAVSIIGILVVVMGFSYQGWMGRYKVETTVKDLYSDLMEARARALQMNRPYLAEITATSYRIAEDSNEDGAIQAAEVIKAKAKTPAPGQERLEYDLAGGLATYTLSKRGIISSSGVMPGTVNVVLPAGILPDYDCISIRQTQIKTGLINTTDRPGDCDER